MKYCVIVLCTVVLVAADVSHLFNGDHHHENQDHSGYNYPKPSVAFNLPNREYLPPQPAATYLPPTVPTTPATTYLPPTSLPTTQAPPPPPPVPTYLPPSNEYLPPTEKPIFRIPIPSYAAPLEYDFVPEPTNEYLPPVSEQLQAEPEPETEQSGYHYDVPSIPFRF